MKKIKLNLLFVLLFFAASSAACQTHATSPKQKIQVLKIEMFLSAFSVESDGFPSISATIDFKKHTSKCLVSYDNPKYKGRSYSLTKMEMDTIRQILEQADLTRLKPHYDVSSTDQPTSTITITTTDGIIKTEDRGLEGEDPLPALYRIVYKLDKNFL